MGRGACKTGGLPYIQEGRGRNAAAINLDHDGQALRVSRSATSFVAARVKTTLMGFGFIGAEPQKLRTHQIPTLRS